MRSRSKRLAAAGLFGAIMAGTLAWSERALAEGLAYVRASSQHLRAKDGSKYHPLNLLDDDPATIWCEGAESLGEGEEIEIFFKQPTRIDRLVVGPTPRTGRLIQRVELTDGYNTVGVQLGDAYVEQSFSPPMRGEKYILRIVRVGGPNKADPEVSEDVACLGDVLMYFKKRPFGGRLPPSAFRHNKYRDRILGSWNGGPLGAPEKFMTFALDGSWTWKYRPLMGGKPKQMSGEYRFRGNRLLMRQGETGRWSDVRFSYSEVTVDPTDPGAPESDYAVISFNDALGKLFEGDYNNAQF